MPILLNKINSLLLHIIQLDVEWMEFINKV